MKQFKNILVATDTRWDKHPIVDEAAEIAQHNGAALKIVDVVPEFPWTVRMAIKDHEHLRSLMGREKQKRLESLAAPIRDQGVSVGTTVLKGKGELGSVTFLFCTRCLCGNTTSDRGVRRK